MNLQNRYADAYLVAQMVNGTGQTVKLVGFLFAALVTLGGLVAASKMGAVVGFAGLLFGILVALPFYALGVLVSAQGQILKATLDTAVNTSPILSQDEIRHILIGTPLPVVPARAEPPSAQVPLRPLDTADITLPSDSPLLPQPAAKRSCPHCGGALESDASRCRWCMKKI
jgi:hypothetical protein